MKSFATIAVFLIAALVVVPARADQRNGNGKNSDVPRTETKSSLTDSVRRVERQTGGEVLSAEPMQRDGRQVNRVKVLTNDGRVRVMQLDSEAKSDKKSPPTNRNQKDADTKDGGDPNQF